MPRLPRRTALRGRGSSHNHNVVHHNRNYGRDQNFCYGGDQHIYSGGQIGQMSGGVFNQNNAGRDFVHNFYTTIADHAPDRRIWDFLVGVGASHKAEPQVERGTCLPGTREEVIRIILDWIQSHGPDHILWLSGAAGVGKSAIAMSIAQICEEQGTFVSSFFFSRFDPKRNNPSSLWLTVAHDLTLIMPVLKEIIEKEMVDNRRILEESLENQFHKLILDPEPDFKWEGGLWGFVNDQVPAPRVVIIDGLDECGDERTQLRILSILRSAFQRVPHFPLRFLVCSRPEAWIREAFAANSLCKLSKHVVLDDEFLPARDIIKYYLHHFQEIRGDPQYDQVKFPTPWPSKPDLKSLVERTDRHFIYAATAIRFIRQAYSQPIEQLQVILYHIPSRRRGTSPFDQLDALYHFILSVNPHREEVISILAVILVFSGHEELESAGCPACIESILGLPSGQVASTLRGMHSVLDIHGHRDKIFFYHNSFREYLLDSRRSGPFHIDLPMWKRTIAQIWLRNLSTKEIRAYSSDQLWDEENGPFFKKWICFCVSIPEPTRDLLDILWNVDLAATFVIPGYYGWKEVYKGLIRWVRKYRLDSTAGGNQGPSDPGGQAEAGEIPRSKMDNRGDGLDLVEGLVRKFEKRPQYFHLVWPPGTSPPDNVVYWIVGRAAGCPWATRLEESRPSVVDDVRLMECRCDLSGGNESRDSGHLGYQEACLKLVKDYISLFEELSQSGVEDSRTIAELSSILWNMTESSLLKLCRFDTELYSLCRKFFELAKGCLIIRSDTAGRENMLRWFETFPHKLPAEGEVLKAKLLDLPWELWKQNYRRWRYKRP